MGAREALEEFVHEEPLKAIFILSLITALILFKLNKARVRAEVKRR